MPNSNAPAPVGSLLAGKRCEAHHAFDLLWQKGIMGRQEAYNWLAEQLDIPIFYCHIGKFDIVTCRRVVELCAPMRRELLLSEMEVPFAYPDLA